MTTRTKATLVAYGDCNTLGFREEEGNSYPEKLGQALGLDVTNLGHTMSTTREMLAYAKDYPPSNYDIACIQYGLVDTWLTFKHSPYVPYYPSNPWRKFLRTLVKKLKKYARILRLHDILGSVNVVSLEEYLTNLEQVILSAPNTRFILIATSPSLDEPRNPRILHYNQALSALTGKHANCIYVDAYDDIYPQRHKLLYPDGIHLNSTAHTLLTNKILETLRD